MRFVLKVLVSALVIACVSELGKRYTAAAAILASLPLTSILAIVWLYSDTNDVTKISALSCGIFWAVIPSLGFFILLPYLLKSGLHFSWSMVLACGIMFVCYSLYAMVLQRLGISI